MDMKLWKKLIPSIFMFSMLFLFSSKNLLAAEPYEYTITVSAGNRGLINGQEKVQITCAPNEEVNLATYISQIQLTEDKYYVKGIRLSGRDNSEPVVSTVFKASEDADYVVAYGIKVNQVAYTISYQNEAGEPLVADAVFYGNVGDKPVVAYQYIEGYVPQTLAMTKTLHDNASENIFVFQYKPVEQNQVVETTTTVTTVVPVTTTTTGAAATGTQEVTAAGTQGVTTGTTGTSTLGGGTQTTSGETVEIPNEETPRELVDLDEEEIPKANVSLKEDTKKGFPMVAGILICILSMAALGTLILSLKKRKK